MVELLVPQRWPLLMVDRVERLIEGPRPSLVASRYISASDIVFKGHFPGLHLWPGTLTIEGLGQSGAILLAILTISDRARATTGSDDAGYDALRNLERGFTLQPGFDADAAATLVKHVQSGNAGLPVAAAVDVKLRRPVFAGQRLDYRVTLTHRLDNMVRFAVEATVADVVVADGSMTGSRLPMTLPADLSS